MGCCGAESSLDWVTSHWANQTDPPQHRRQHYRFLVPDSCCFDRSADGNSMFATIRQMAPVCRNARLVPANKVTVSLYASVIDTEEY